MTSSQGSPSMDKTKTSPSIAARFLEHAMSGPKEYFSPYSSTNYSTPDEPATTPSWNTLSKTMNDLEQREVTAVTVQVIRPSSSLLNKSTVEANATGFNSEVPQRTALPQETMNMNLAPLENLCKIRFFRFTPEQKVYLEEEVARTGSIPNIYRRREIANIGDYCVALTRIKNWFYDRRRNIRRNAQRTEKKKSLSEHNCTDLPPATMTSSDSLSDLFPTTMVSPDGFSNLYPGFETSPMFEALPFTFYDGLPSSPGEEEQQERPSQEQPYNYNRAGAQINNMDREFPNKTYTSPEYAVNPVAYQNYNHGGDFYVAPPTNMHLLNMNFTSPANAVNFNAYPISNYEGDFYATSPTNKATVNNRGIVQAQDIGTHLPFGVQIHFPSEMNLQYPMPTYNRFNQSATQYLPRPSTPPRQILPKSTSDTDDQLQLSSSRLSDSSTASTYTEFWGDYSSPLANLYTKKQEEKAQSGHDMSEKGVDLFNICKTQQGTSVFGDEVGENQQEEDILSGSGKFQQENIELLGSGIAKTWRASLGSQTQKQKGGSELFSGGNKHQFKNEPTFGGIISKMGRSVASEDGYQRQRKKIRLDKPAKTAFEPKKKTLEQIEAERELAERFMRQCVPINNSYQEQRLQCILMNHLQEELQINPHAPQQFFAPNKVTEQLIYHKSLPIEDLCLDYFGLTFLPGINNVDISIYIWKEVSNSIEATMGHKHYRIDALAICFDKNGTMIEAMFGDMCKGFLTIDWFNDKDPRAFDFDNMTFEDLLQLLRRTAMRNFDEEGNVRTPAEQARRDEQLGELFPRRGK
ncbi:hypothetical protein N431DRAFT_454409 [Stipitochalara longipes BDJ]|nr:hypothetical protein N431DRAFT_454409 [Stipitochalara longipes BDJ]